MSRAGNLSSAEFLRSRGWGVGSVLRGEPIFHDGKQIERARLVRITAIGEQGALARTQIIGEPDWWRESSYDFNSRDWSLHTPADRTKEGTS